MIRTKLKQERKPKRKIKQGAVLKNSIKQKAESTAEHEKNKRRKAEYFRTKHKPKKLIAFNDTPNIEQHVEIHKDMFTIENKTAKTIYFTLSAFADYKVDKQFHLSISNICKFSGLSYPTVIKGLKQLQNITFEGNRLLNITKQTIGEVTLNKYNLWVLRAKERQIYKDQYEPFHAAIVRSGRWAVLSQRAKALYLAFRYYAFFDYQEYLDEEFDDRYHQNYHIDDVYPDRKWESCIKTLTAVFQRASISLSNKSIPIEELIDANLLSNYGHLWRVYLVPYDLDETNY